MFGFCFFYLHDNFKIGLIIRLPLRVSNNESNKKYPQPLANVMTLGKKITLNSKCSPMSPNLQVNHFHLQVMKNLHV